MNPGSDEAVKKGCCCGVLDNGHGNGCGQKDKDGTPLFWINGNCPLHGERLEQARIEVSHLIHDYKEAKGE